MLEYVPSCEGESEGILSYIKNNMMTWNQAIRISPEQETRLRRAFELFDMNEDGLLTIQELSHVRNCFILKLISPVDAINGFSHEQGRCLKVSKWYQL